MKCFGISKWFQFLLHKIRKHAVAVLVVAILLILLKALIYPNTIDILVVTVLFILLIALVDD